MSEDVLIDFYLMSVKVELMEYQSLRAILSEDESTIVTKETESLRRQLGAAAFRLVQAALPSFHRTSRLFRIKYTEEFDVSQLERCLLTLAYKVINFRLGSTDREYDLRSAQPSATNYLDTLTRMQCLVSSAVEQAIDANKVCGTLNNDEKSNECLQGDKLSQTIEGANAVCPSDTYRDEATTSLSVTPKASTSIPNLSSLLHDASNRTTTVMVEVGSVKLQQTVQLPPAYSTLISPELCHTLAELDRAAAYFEFEFVRCLSRRLRTLRESDDLQLVTVLFSETLMWCMAVGLFTVEQIADRDPCVMLALPRLAIMVGVRLLPESPIGSNRLATGGRLPYLFVDVRRELAYLSRQLFALRPDQLCRLAQWLGPRGLPSLKGWIASPAHANPHDASSNPRRFWRANLHGLHQLYKSISSVADQVTSKNSSEIRVIFQIVIELHDKSNEIAALAELEGTKNSMCTTDQAAPESTIENEDDEDELQLDANQFIKSHMFSSLNGLLDWSNVLNNPGHKYDLEDALKRCFSATKSIARKISKTAHTGELPSSHPSSSPKNEFSVSRKSTQQVEYGVDAASWLCNPMDQSAQTPNDFKGNLNALLGDKHGQLPELPPASIAHRLNKLNLGVSVLGVQDYFDQTLNYLPPWQPDRLSPVNRISDWTYTDEENSADDDSGDDSNYVVGRQCASCWRIFTLVRRRHHCRRCGHIFCSSCCNQWQTVEGVATDSPVRICSECYTFTNASST